MFIWANIYIHTEIHRKIYIYREKKLSLIGTRPCQCFNFTPTQLFVVFWGDIECLNVAEKFLVGHVAWQIEEKRDRLLKVELEQATLVHAKDAQGNTEQDKVALHEKHIPHATRNV